MAKIITVTDLTQGEHRTLQVRCHERCSFKAGFTVDLSVEKMGGDRWRLRLYFRPVDIKGELVGLFDLQPPLSLASFAPDATCTLACLNQDPVLVVRHFLLGESQLEITPHNVDLDENVDEENVEQVDLTLVCGDFTTSITISAKEAAEFLEISATEN